MALKRLTTRTFLTATIAIFLCSNWILQTDCEEITCPSGTLMSCGEGFGCIDRGQFCNGIDDCPNGADEVLYDPEIHSSLNGSICRLLRNGVRRSCYIEEEYICDHELDCFFGSDERDCAHTFQCPDTAFGSEFFRLRVQFCDGREDCPFMSDETPYSYDAEGFQCAVTKTLLTNFCQLPNQYVCDGTADCDGGTDECFCDSELLVIDNQTLSNNRSQDFYRNQRCFRCLDGSLVVSAAVTCNGIFNCHDLSDECLCPENSRVKPPELCQQICKVGEDCGNCNVNEVMCNRQSNKTGNTTCISREQVCDRTFDCPGHEDENREFCGWNTTQLFFCNDGISFIDQFRQCNDVIDCNDGSDEIGCNVLFLCKRNDFSDSDFAKPRYAISCDMIPECEDLDDECNTTLCGDMPAFCNFVRGDDGFICPSTLSALIGKEICDGYPTCDDTAPNTSADELYCPNVFYCEDLGEGSLPIHIPTSAYCDAITDCFDGSDEVNCSLTTHFYCDGGNVVYIPRNKVCNGIQDCENGEDECQNCAVTAFSSDKFLINSFFLQASIWIMAILALLGNSYVVGINVIYLRKKWNSISPLGLGNRVLIINLAVADILIGIYLLAVAVTNVVYQNHYCTADIEWRGSTKCIWLGCLIILGSEASVFILTIMTTQRLVIISSPITNDKLHQLFIYVTGLGWILAFLIAFIPTVDQFMYYFLSEIWYRDNPYLTITTREGAASFVRKLWTLQNQTDMMFSANTTNTYAWETVIDAVSRLNPSYIPEIHFGYYSADGVCLPRLFPDPTTDQSYGYSLFILVINFVAFIYMLGAYVGIYRLSTRRAQQAGRDGKSTKFQKKVTRIVVTNFCCWIPICIMAFISVAGVRLSDQAYAAAAIILLPINSAANPFLYSNLPDVLWRRLLPIRMMVGGCYKQTRERAMSMDVSKSISIFNTTDRTNTTTAGSPATPLKNRKKQPEISNVSSRL